MMPGWTQILIVLVLVVLLFGRGKISTLMGDVAQGIKSFKKGMADDDAAVAKTDEPAAVSDPKTIDHATTVDHATAEPVVTDGERTRNAG